MKKMIVKLLESAVRAIAKRHRRKAKWAKHHTRPTKAEMRRSSCGTAIEDLKK